METAGARAALDDLEWSNLRSRLCCLSADQALKIYRLLAPISKKEVALLEEQGSSEVASRRGNSVARAREAVAAIDEKLQLFPIYKNALIERREEKRDKDKLEGRVPKRGRRPPEENYWLANEVADILHGVPGVWVKASKAGPTVFSKILKVCFEAVGQRGSVERYAVAPAKQERPVVVDEETWREYLAATSKRGKTSQT